MNSRENDDLRANIMIQLHRSWSRRDRRHQHDVSEWYVPVYIPIKKNNEELET